MSFFKKITKSISKTYEATKEKVEESMSGITNKYPDLNEVFDVLSGMRAQYNDHVDQTDSAEADDDKWRPAIMTLGLLYKLQKLEDTSWYNKEQLFLRDETLESRMLDTFGFFWHHCVEVAKCLRNAEHADGESNAEGLKDEESIVQDLTASLGLPADDVVMAYSSDSLHVDDHCPDFAMVINHGMRMVIFTICGTRMIPCPNMKDVFMDLYADAEPFLHGHAHRGMAIGTKNIMEKVSEALAKTLEANPGYSVTVIGYSLGAGICQLVTMDLLEGDSKDIVPEGTKIYCINFGAPPVFVSDNANYKCPNIFSVVYANDGLVSASIANITKLFMQIKAVERLGMRRRDMIRLLWNDAETEADSDFGDSTEKPKVSVEDSVHWKKIRDAVMGVPNVGIPHLEHPAQQLFIIKRREMQIVTRKFRQTRQIATNLRLRAAMFSNHMPWGYNALFDGYGQDPAKVDTELLDEFVAEEIGEEELGEGTEAVAEERSKNSLYPDLSDL